MTVVDLLQRWKQEFQEHDVSKPEESAQHILMHVMGYKTISDIYSKQARLRPEDVEKIESLCAKRLERVPIPYIIKEWRFRDVVLKMAPPVFIPWPETERLVDIVLQEIDAQGAKEVLEFCCGSGAISLALLKARPELKVLTLDKSEEACQLTMENARRNGLADRVEVLHTKISDFRPGSWSFSIIVSNPPYISTKEMNLLQPETQLYEDLDALNGGEDGSDVVKAVLQASSDCLSPGGKLFLEANPSHPPILQSYLKENPALGLVFVRALKDFAGKDRYIEIVKAK